jgi:hypothetical protein
MAIEALGLHLCLMEEDGDALPEATIPPFTAPFTEELPDKAIVMPVSVFPELAGQEQQRPAPPLNEAAPVKVKQPLIAAHA